MFRFSEREIDDSANAAPGFMTSRWIFVGFPGPAARRRPEFKRKPAQIAHPVA
jgi:hypothetical protein